MRCRDISNDRGFSVLESILATAILSITALASYFVFVQQSTQLSAVRVQEGESQVESEIKTYVMAQVTSYFNTSARTTVANRCRDNKYATTHTQFRDLWITSLNQPVTTPSGVILNIITSSNPVASYVPGNLPSTLLPAITSFGKYTAAMQRCAASQSIEVNPNFSNNSGLYFCMAIGGSYTSSYSNFLSMQPILAEFMFTVTDVTTNSAVPCISYNPYFAAQVDPYPAAGTKVVRNLYYSLYWTHSIDWKRSTAGFSTAANAEDPNIYSDRSTVFSLAGLQ